MCRQNPGECISWAMNSRLAINFAEAAGTNDNEVNALRHAYWSALLTAKFGSTQRALAWTEAHELGSVGSDPGDTCRDRANSTTGRGIGVAHSSSWGSPNQAQLQYDLRQDVLTMHTQRTLQYLPTCM